MGRIKVSVRTSVVTAMLMVAVLLAAGACKKKPAEQDIDTMARDLQARAKATPPEQRVVVSAPTLIARYLRNEVGADEKYRHKVLIVAGIVDSINRDPSTDTPLVFLREQGGLIECTFPKADAPTLASLTPGAKVVFLGVGAGISQGHIRILGCTYSEEYAEYYDDNTPSLVISEDGKETYLMRYSKKWNDPGFRAAKAKEDDAAAREILGETGTPAPDEEGNAPSPRRARPTRAAPSKGNAVASSQAPVATDEAPQPEPKAELPKACLAYRAAITKLSKCTALPEATRDALKQSYEQTAAAWASVPPEALDSLSISCTASTDAVRQALSNCTDAPAEPGDATE